MVQSCAIASDARRVGQPAYQYRKQATRWTITVAARLMRASSRGRNWRPALRHVVMHLRCGRSDAMVEFMREWRRLAGGLSGFGGVGRCRWRRCGPAPHRQLPTAARARGLRCEPRLYGTDGRPRRCGGWMVRCAALRGGRGGQPDGVRAAQPQSGPARARGGPLDHAGSAGRCGRGAPIRPPCSRRLRAWACASRRAPRT